MSEECLKLKNQLCFPLYAAAKDVTKKYTPILNELGLTYTQYIAMLVLWEKDSISVKELGECLFLDSGTITPLIKKLESQGLVKRERDTMDERIVKVHLTEAGNKLQEKAVCVPGKMGGKLPLSQEECETLYGLLYKILDHE